MPRRPRRRPPRSPSPPAPRDRPPADARAARRDRGALLTIAAPASARSADITAADVALRLAPNGDLLVTERLTFEYDGHFEGSYRDIHLLPRGAISDVSVSQDGQRFSPGGNTALGSDDRPGVFGTVDMGSAYRVVWHYRATDEQRATTVSYRVRDAVVAYDDVLDIGWAVWGSQWDFDLDHLTASFTNPALDPGDPLYRVWGHPRDVEGTTARGEGEATLSAEDVDSGTAVELRVTMPRDPARSYPGARVASGEGLPTILAEEQALDDDFNSPRNQFKRFVAKHAFLLALAIALFAWLLVGLLAWLARERDAGVPEYLPEPPDDATPAVAYALAHEGDHSTDTVLATLLDLVDRGYYDTAQTTTDEEKLDLSLEQKAERPNEELTVYEQDVLAFFDQVLDGKRLALSDMKRSDPEALGGLARALGADDREARRGRRGHARLGSQPQLGPLADRARELGADRGGGPVRARRGGAWFIAGAIGFVNLVGLSALPATRFKRVDSGHVERAEQWQAFAHWTEDFPRLSDDPPATLELWKRILVYGVAFGTAKRMISSGRIPEPVVAEASGGSHGAPTRSSAASAAPPSTAPASAPGSRARSRRRARRAAVAAAFPVAVAVGSRAAAAAARGERPPLDPRPWPS